MRLEGLICAHLLVLKDADSSESSQDPSVAETPADKWQELSDKLKAEGQASPDQQFRGQAW